MTRRRLIIAYALTLFSLLSPGTVFAQGEVIGVLEVEFDKEYTATEDKLVFIQGPGEYILTWEGGSREMSLEKGEEKLIELQVGDKLVRY
jgi:hypothetical protein